jgi:hypothetical protein
LDGTDLERDGDDSMRFRLTYLGPLKASQDRAAGSDPNKTDRRSEHKHEIRRKFHGQLKRLWATDKFLRESEAVPAAPPLAVTPSSAVAVGIFGRSGASRALSEVLADQYSGFGYRFVPLVRADAHLSCAVRILFLRRDPPGAVYNLGDIDNRVKTVLDALRKPVHSNQVPGPPQAEEDPFFVLLEDDKLITHLEVETDTLYLPLTGKPDDAALAHLVISVDVRPHYVTMQNLSYVA